MSYNIFINKKVWSAFTEKEMQEYIEQVFLYYRKKGFPFYPTDMKSRYEWFERLKRYDCASVLDSRTLKQTMHGLNLAWSYFPCMWNIPCNGLRTPLECFNNDFLLRKVIEKRIKMGDNMSDAGLRKMLKIFSGNQCVSNFRPTAACALYNHFAENGTVYDMSMGWGGRLLGFIVSKAKKYIGCDPSVCSYNGCMEIKKDFGDGKEIELYRIGSEDFVPQKDSIDFCFTSPPYFDCEKYSDEPTQSYLKFPAKTEWCRGFLTATFRNCYYALKDRGVMAINISDTKTFKDLGEKTVIAAQEAGFTLEDTWLYLLSSLSHKTAFKSEPVFIFQKH